MSRRDRWVARAEAHHRDLAKAFGTLAKERWPTSDAGTVDVGSGVAVFMGQGFYVNRAVGLGMGSPVAMDDLATVEDFYTSRKQRIEIQLSSEAVPSVLPMLAARGYQLTLFRNLYARDLDGLLDAPADPALDLGVREVTTASFAAWQHVHGRSFTSDSARRTVNDAFCTIAAQVPGAHDYLATLGDTPVAVCSLIVRDGVGSLGGMATLQAYRSRGIQAALLRFRLLQARALGCDLAITSADPGTPSARNVERAGFRLLMVHAFLVATG